MKTVGRIRAPHAANVAQRDESERHAEYLYGSVKVASNPTIGPWFSCHAATRSAAHSTSGACAA
jgi:hypothetical protein